LALLLTLPMYLLRAFGAGDVKLLMLVGAAAGTGGLMQIAAIAIVTAALMGLGMSIITGRMKLFVANLQTGALAMIAGDLQTASSVSAHTAYRIPFALAVAVATVLWLLYLW
jgi:prepilin peptidase CpaA